jgi:predicted nucleic acid-binding protein
LARLPEGRRRTDLEAKAARLLAALPVEPAPPEAAAAFAQIKIARRARGLSRDENDLWIAATAQALSATQVARDGDFLRIEGLLVVTP